jgi:cytochrome c oxidase assembly protein subunit 15
MFLQVIMGAYVAGLDAGLVYPEWPTMGGALYPPGEPFAPFTEQSAAQWLHRMVGYGVFLAALGFALLSRRSAFAKTRRWGWIVLGVTLVQIVIGVHAVLLSVPLWLGLAHQFGAILLFGAVIHAWRQNAYPQEERIGA